MNIYLKYFVRGLIFMAPLAVTTLFIVYIISIITNTLHWVDLDAITITILLIIIFAIITAIGYLGSSLIAVPIGESIERAISRVPLINFVYTALKDITSAFVGDKKKFDKPVLVTLNPQFELKKFGFITQESLDRFGIEDHVSVYLPHSYGFSGDLFIVKKEYVESLDVSASDMLKFIVSGGVVSVSEIKEKKEA